MKFRSTLVGLTIVSACMSLPTVQGQKNTVTKVVVAPPKIPLGPCPATVEFVGTIFVSRPARVDYRWERSDGATGPRESVDIRSAAKSVTNSWRVGTPRKPFSGWQRLRVLAPNGVVSNTAPLQIKCS